MPVLELRPRGECAFDHVSLGEVMLRLDPGDMRVRTARGRTVRNGLNFTERGYDRVGGGDSFASGLIYGLLTTGDLQTAVEYGAGPRGPGHDDAG